MPSIEDLIVDLRKYAPELGIYFSPPLPQEAAFKIILAMKNEIGIELPSEYLQLSALTDGIQTQNGYLARLEDICAQNRDIWFYRPVPGKTANGDFQITYAPIPPEERRVPKYLWLGYEGNMAEFIYHPESGMYRDRPIGDENYVSFQSPTLVEFLKHMVDRGR
jgi:hypothetical protein